MYWADRGFIGCGEENMNQDILRVVAAFDHGGQEKQTAWNRGAESQEVYSGHSCRSTCEASWAQALSGEDQSAGGRVSEWASGGRRLTERGKHLVWAAWLAGIAVFAALHAMHLRADFPNGSPWFTDWAKYTDEGWYGNAAIRAHLFGNWYRAGDFNPAVALPVWPALEWLLFCVTGVTVEAARGLAVGCFTASLALSYLLLRVRGSRWVGLLAVTLLVTSPFLYCFSRLAILEPLLTVLTLAALNGAVRLGQVRRPVGAAAGIGALFALMLLTKATAVFLLPALAWALLMALRDKRKLAARCALAAAATAAAAYGLWLAAVAHAGLMPDFRYLFFVNSYPKPGGFAWPAVSLWWSFHGGLWVDPILIPLAGIVVVSAAAAWCRSPQAETEWGAWGRGLLLDPVLGAAVAAVAGFVVFMACQNHPQPRYFAVVAVFCCLIVAQGAETLLRRAGSVRRAGWVVAGLALVAAGLGAAQTVRYTLRPQYTFVQAADAVVRFMDTHPNGRRMLVSVSGDEISMVTHLPALCDDFGTEPLPAKMAAYQPGWYAAWNDLDPNRLEDLHQRYSLEQVASFAAFDDPERNVLVLFKLHPLPQGRLRDPRRENLRDVLPEDSIAVPVE